VPTRVHKSVAPRQWIPLPDAARRLGLRFDSVIGLIHTGYLVGYLACGRRWFVRRDSLERYRAWRKAA
jgi:hypothetical protein